MSSRRQKVLSRVNWYLQSTFYYRGGRYRQVALYDILVTTDTKHRGTCLSISKTEFHASAQNNTSKVRTLMTSAKQGIPIERFFN